ncbi:sodium- and chloride-dependent GABA transporter 3-like [Bolinopsis microptera]|uniref:sodium- and chloride-dependent GABA transporter 3-like n=1 Tax=Bolinopsis microptera TaxID=2820187 RepID=UPI00307A953B
MPLPQLWAAAFFFMMVLLAIDSEFGTIEACVGPLQDYPFFQKIRKEVLCLILCVLLCLLGLPMCTQSGLYVFVLWIPFCRLYQLRFYRCCRVCGGGVVLRPGQVLRGYRVHDRISTSHLLETLLEVHITYRCYSNPDSESSKAVYETSRVHNIHRLRSP